MRILQVVGSLNPSIGGPIEGVRQSYPWLVSAGHEVELLTMDDPADPRVRASPMKVHAVGPIHLGYAYTPRLGPWLRSNLGRFDITVLHGLWQYPSIAVWRTARALGVPYVVFPHGMLDPYFQKGSPWKHRKKAIYWRLFEGRVLRDSAAVAFTSERERTLARESFHPYQVNEAVVRYGTSQPNIGMDIGMDEARMEFLQAHPTLKDKRCAMFMGRIHPKKGCDLLLRAFAEVLAADPDWRLVMAGPDQTGWQAELEALAANLGIADHVAWTGMLTGEMKWGAFRAAEVFVLPSHQENFGIVVAEALMCGVPVLISREVNIWQEVLASGAGLCDEDTVEGTCRMLRQWNAMAEGQRQAMRSATRPCFQEYFEAEAAAASLATLLERCLHGPGAAHVARLKA